MSAESATPAGGRTAWRVDGASSLATFAVRNFGLNRVTGTVPLTDGSVLADASGAVVAVEGRADATRVDTRNARRDKDLRARRLLAVTEFPAWSFASRSVRRTSGGWEIDGDLTVRTTAALTLRVHEVHEVAPGVARLSATASLDRRLVGVRAPRVLVGRRVEVTLDVVLQLIGPPVPDRPTAITTPAVSGAAGSR